MSAISRRFSTDYTTTKLRPELLLRLVAGRTLRGSDIAEANGWVLYVSDRRGDYDFDGEYDMEDIYGKNDGMLQAGEDINGNNRLDTDYSNEAVKYTGFGAAENPDIAAVLEHKFYRRGVRLVNGNETSGKLHFDQSAQYSRFYSRFGKRRLCSGKL